MGLDPATAAYQQYGYNERPVEAQLGPHHLRIPANYFRDQIGPDFQGNFSLLVQWPDLEPLPPGKRSGQDMDTFDQAQREMAQLDAAWVQSRTAQPTQDAQRQPAGPQLA